MLYIIQNAENFKIFQWEEKTYYYSNIFSEKDVFTEVLIFIQNKNYTYNNICRYFSEWIHLFIWYILFTQELKNCRVSEQVYQRQKRLEKEKKRGGGAQKSVLISSV